MFNTLASLQRSPGLVVTEAGIKDTKLAMVITHMRFFFTDIAAFFGADSGPTRQDFGIILTQGRCILRLILNVYDAEIGRIVSRL